MHDWSIIEIPPPVCPICKAANNSFKIILVVHRLVIWRMASVPLPQHTWYCNCNKCNFGGQGTTPLTRTT